jgi:hypothetical protein
MTRRQFLLASAFVPCAPRITRRPWLDRTFPGSRGIRWVSGGKLFFPEEFPDVVTEEARRLWNAR